MADSCAIARERLVSAVNELRPATGREKVLSAVKAGFLGSVVTPMKMFGGNAFSLGLRTLAVHPVEAGVDYLRAVAKSATEGKFSLSPNEFRTVRLALDADGMGRFAHAFRQGMEPTIGAVRAAKFAASAQGGPWKAVREAVTTFSRELNLRLDAEHIYRTTEYQGNTHYNNPLSEAAVNGVFGVAEALDRPFWRAAHDFSTHIQSTVLAAAEGLKGPELKARRAELFDHPTDAMALRAVDHANYANYVTFKNKTVLGNAAQDLKTGLARRADQPIPEGLTPHEETKLRGLKAAHTVGSLAVEMNLPFTGVPSSVAGQSFSLGTGPLGLVRLIFTANRNPARAATVIAESGVGTGLIATGYKLAAEGHLVGPAPTGSEKAQFDAEGKQPYSVKIGDKWFDLRFAMPVGAPLFAGASLYWAKGKTLGDKAIAGVGAISKMLTNQTYLQNANALIQALQDPEHRGRWLVASQVPIPSVLGQIARATDSTERNATSIPEMLALKIPGLSRVVPPKVDALGRTQTRTGLERLSEVLSPFRIKQSTETDVTKEFRRLGISLSLPAASVTVRGQKVERDGAEQSAYIPQVGIPMAQRLSAIIASPAYRNASDEERSDALLKMRDAFHRQYGKRDALRRILGATKPRTIPE